MISLKQLNDLPVGKPVDIDLVEYLHVIAQNKKLCDDVLSHPGLFRLGKSKSLEESEYIDVKKGELRAFLRENDINGKDVVMMSKLLSLDLIKKGYDEVNIKAIKRGFALAQYYLEQTKEFDFRYFREMIDSAAAFFIRLPEDNESYKALKRDVADMMDVLLGEVQRFIDPKEKLEQNESYFYRIAGDYHLIFEGPREAYDYYEAGIKQRDVSCYAPFCRLQEELGDMDNAIITAENGWNEFKDRICLEDYIRLLYKKGDPHSMSIAGTMYQKYMVLFPDDYKPINDFRSQFDFIDFPTLNKHLIDIHAHGSGKVFSGEFTESYLDVMKKALERNAGIMKWLSAAKNADILDTDAGNNIYQETLTDQLIVLQRGAFDLLDTDSLRLYVEYLKNISEENLGYNFFMNFFEYHAVEHVEIVAHMSENQDDPNIQNPTQVRTKNIKDTLGERMMYHFLFLIYHYGFTDEGLVDDLVIIAQNLQMNEEIIDNLKIADADMQGFRKTFEIFPESLKTQFLTLRDNIIKERGEMFVRKAEHSIFKQYGMAPLGKGDDVEVILYLFSLGCFSRSRETIRIFIAQLDGLMFSQEQAKYVGQMLMQISIHDQAIEYLIDFADINDIEVLDTICQIGVIRPELVPNIHTRFTQKLSDMDVEPKQIQYFLEQIEEDIQTGNRSDVSLGKIKKLLAMSHWMEGKSILERTEKKDTTKDIESAGSHFQETLDLFSESLELAARDGKEDPDSEKFQDTYKEIALGFSEFIMHHTDDQLQAYGLLLNIYERYEDAVILHLLAQIAINLDLRLEAHKWITLMDANEDTDAIELWLKYFFASSSMNERMSAVYMLVELNEKLRGFVDDEIIHAIEKYANEQFTTLKNKKNTTDEEETHLFHLERYFSVGFKRSLSNSVTYWKKLTGYIQQGDIQFLEEFFSPHSDAGKIADISPKMSEEKQEQHRLLTNLLGERDIFLSQFEAISSEDEKEYHQLIHEINGAFYALSDMLGLGLVQDALDEMNERVHILAQEEYGQVNVQQVPYRLH